MNFPYSSPSEFSHSGSSYPSPLQSDVRQVKPAQGLQLSPVMAATRSGRLSINQMTTLRSSFQEDLASYRSAGVPAIGVSWRKLVQSGIERGVRNVLDSGLAVSSVGWLGGFTGQHGATIKETIREAQRAIRVAARLRAPNVVIVTGPLAGHITPHARRLVTESLRELAGIADRYGVTLALKPMDPLFRSNWTFVNTLDTALDLISRVSHRRVKLAYGTYHHWQEDAILDLVRQSASQIAHVQLADWKPPRDEHDQVLPGDGCIPFSETLQSLEEGGYFGWLELEVWSRDLWKLHSADLIKRCMSSMDLLLTQPSRLDDPPTS